MSGFRPMLASELNESLIKAHFAQGGVLMLSPKVDGIRGTVINGKVMSRSGKELPNTQLQELFGGYEHYDGEFVATLPNHELVYKKAFTGCMKKDAVTDLHFWVFDHVENLNDPYVTRLARLGSNDRVHILPQKIVSTWEQVVQHEAELLEQGYEGAMLRRPNVKYDNKRAKGVDLMKVKRCVDMEFPILDILEGESNTNEKFTDELGFSKRSSAQDGKVPNGMAGKFLCPWLDTTFKVSMGKFDHDERREILANREHHIKNSVLKVRFFGYGTSERPRHPRAMGFRAPEDT